MKLIEPHGVQLYKYLHPEISLFDLYRFLPDFHDHSVLNRFIISVVNKSIGELMRWN